MSDLKLAPIESQFADLIWENAPLSTGELIKLCAQQFEWKRTTTYTVLKRLNEKGLFRTENGQITVLITKPDYEAMQSEQFVEDTFHGSLPAFLAAFGSRRKMSQTDIEEVQKMIDRMRESK